MINGENQKLTQIMTIIGNISKNQKLYTLSALIWALEAIAPILLVQLE